jgi:hypothetical protein
MKIDQIEVLDGADRLKPGEEKWFSERRLKAAFGDDVATHGTLEAAVCSHLPGYSLRKHAKGPAGYFLRRHA